MDSHPFTNFLLLVVTSYSGCTELAMLSPGRAAATARYNTGGFTPKRCVMRVPSEPGWRISASPGFGVVEASACVTYDGHCGVITSVVT